MSRDFWNGDDLEYDEFYDKYCDDETLRQEVLTEIIKDRKHLMWILEDIDYFQDMLNAKINNLYNNKDFNE